MGEFDWLTGNSGGGDSVMLADLRRKRLEETRRNLAKRGRGFSTGATPDDALTLEEDLNADPDTGLDAQKQVSNVENRLAGEAAYMSPGATEVRQSKQQDELSKMLAVPSLQGKNAFELEQLKQKGARDLTQQGQDFTRELQSGGSGELGSGTTVRVNPKGQASLTMAPEKLNTEQSRALSTISSLEELVPEYDRMMQKNYPGIAQDPAAHSSLSDMFGAKVGGAVYKAGHVPSVDQDHIDQLTGYFEAIVPRMMATGRINREQYEDLKLHAPQLGLSPGANYSRMRYIMDKILPSVRSGIQKTHGQAGGVQDSYANPNWGMQ